MSASHPSANVWAMSDLCTPWCVHVAVTLRIAEHIAAGKDEIKTLAAAADCDADCLQAILRQLIGKGLFEENDAGKFTLNAAARGLLDPGVQLGLDLEGLGGRFAHAWGTMLSYVRTGKAAYHERFGVSFWDDLAAHPEIAKEFDDLIGPAGHGLPEPRFDITGGWDSLRTVVDVGGGTGSMLAEMLRARPAMRGTLVNLPTTVARSAAIFQDAGVAERAKTAGQSFFDPLPPGQDLYVLRGILNDWPDKDAVKILRCCAEAARPAGRVVVLKSVHADSERKGLMIEMILVGGKPRSLTAFSELARSAGLAVLNAGAQPSGYFVVECGVRSN
jgi:hypothetical protein